MTVLTNALSPEQYEALSRNLPTRDDQRFGEVDLGEPLMAPSFVSLQPSGTVVDPLQNAPTRLSSMPDPVSVSVSRESDVPIGESSVAPGSMQTSSRDLTRSQDELVRNSLENADLATVRRRIGGKRTIPTAPFALSDNVDSVSVLDSTPGSGAL